MKAFTPREYQLKAHEQIVEAFKRQIKLLLVMSTGAGKSKTIASFVEKYFKHYNWVIVVRKRDLVNQLAETLTEFDLDFGVFMANDSRYSPKKPIQLCSIDTLDSRGILPFLQDPKDLILIIDEADESLSDGYQEVIYKYTNRHNLARPTHFGASELSKKTRPAFLLGMTATPYDKPLSHFDEYIEPVTPHELRDKYKTLVDYKYFIPKLLDLSKVRVKDGEFNAKDIEREVNSPEAIAEDFAYWLQYGDNRQTLVFCTNQDHAKNVAEYINNYYGQIVAIAVDANTPSDDRKIVYQKFKNGEIRFLVNVRLITRGVDIPIIGTILDLAPTLSINNHLQKIGRGSRPNEAYKDCIVIDMANNLVNNGPFYPTVLRVINLREGKNRSKKDLSDAMMRVCGSCFRAAEPIDFGIKNTCPFCGFCNGKVKEKKLSKAKQKALELEEASPEKIEQIKMISDFKKYLWQLQNLGKRYPYDIAKEKAQLKLIKAYGISRVEKIKGAIGLSETIIRQQKALYDYVPLGGL